MESRLFRRRLLLQAVAASHSLRVHPLRDLNKHTSEISQKTISSDTYTYWCCRRESKKRKCDNFRFDVAEGVGISVATVEFSIQTSRLQKLVANTIPLVASRSLTYGSALETVWVYPREWVSPHRRKMFDYGGKC